MKIPKNDKARVGESLAVSTFLKPLAAFSEKKAATYRKSFKPQYARFKLKFYKNNAEYKVRFSYDFYSRYTAGIKRNVTDESEGLGKLLRLIDRSKYKYFTAVLFCTTVEKPNTDLMHYNYPLYKFVNTQLMEYEDSIDFKTDPVTGNIFLDLSKLRKEPTIKLRGDKPYEIEIGRTFKDYHSKALERFQNDY